MRRTLFAVCWGPLLFNACVVSTHGGAGADLETPPRPRVVREAPAAEHDHDHDEVTKIRAQHVLVAFKGAMRAAPQIIRTKEEAQARAEEVLRRAMEGEPFENLVAEYSDDMGSAARAGDLGRFSRQDMIAEFSKAAFALEPGGLSDVVETAFGFHVIKRTE